MGKRDVSFDLDMPVPEWSSQVGDVQTRQVPAHWVVSDLNDQHAYLRFDPKSIRDQHPAVGQLVGCGISHPCTTFDKWRWMPVVDDAYLVIDAVSVNF
jgi:D-serine dehydratase